MSWGVRRACPPACPRSKQRGTQGCCRGAQTMRCAPRACARAAAPGRRAPRPCRRPPLLRRPRRCRRARPSGGRRRPPRRSRRHSWRPPAVRGAARGSQAQRRRSWLPLARYKPLPAPTAGAHRSLAHRRSQRAKSPISGHRRARASPCSRLTCCSRGCRGPAPWPNEYAAHSQRRGAARRADASAGGQARFPRRVGAGRALAAAGHVLLLRGRRRHLVVLQAVHAADVGTRATPAAASALPDPVAAACAREGA